MSNRTQWEEDARGGGVAKLAPFAGTALVGCSPHVDMCFSNQLPAVLYGLLQTGHLIGPSDRRTIVLAGTCGMHRQILQAAWSRYTEIDNF